MKDLDVLEKINKYKYFHIMNNGFHTFTILNFLNKYFDTDEHCFLFPNPREETKERISTIQNAYEVALENISLEHVDKVIFHGLFTKTVIEFLYNSQNWLEKSFWFIWGGDLYSAEKTKEGEFVRANFAGILTAFDKEVYEKKYGKCKKYYDVTYPHSKLELQLSSKTSPNYTHIQINNSEDETTLEMLDVLAKFKDENIKISTIISYKSTGHKDVAKEIIEKGHALFKDKFNPITKYLTLDKYFEHLSTVDIYISNQNRQQGNGNASVVCSLGNKVFAKSDTSVYTKYSSLGIKYYDTYTIKDLSYKDFIAQDDKVKSESVKRLKERMKDKTKVKQWQFFLLSQ